MIISFSHKYSLLHFPAMQTMQLSFETMLDWQKLCSPLNCCRMLEVPDNSRLLPSPEGNNQKGWRELLR